MITKNLKQFMIKQAQDIGDFELPQATTNPTGPHQINTLQKGEGVLTSPKSTVSIGSPQVRPGDTGGRGYDPSIRIGNKGIQTGTPGQAGHVKITPSYGTKALTSYPDVVQSTINSNKPLQEEGEIPEAQYQDMIRRYLDRIVGVPIQSETQVENGQLQSDRTLSHTVNEALPSNVINKFIDASGYNRPQATSPEIFSVLDEMNNNELTRSEFSNHSRGGKPLKGWY